MDSLSGNRQGFGEVGGVRLAELVEKVGAWEIAGGGEDQLTITMLQVSQMVAQQSVTGHLHPELTKANTATSFALIQVSGMVSVAESA